MWRGRIGRGPRIRRVCRREGLVAGKGSIKGVNRGPEAGERRRVGRRDGLVRRDRLAKGNAWIKNDRSIEGTRE